MAMSLKRTIGSAIQLGLAVALLSAAAPLLAQQYKIKYVSASPPATQTSLPVIWWAEQVEKRTNGRVKIEFFWNGSLVSDAEILGAVSKGMAPMGKIYSVGHVGQMPLAQLANLPFTTEDVYVIQRATADMISKYPAWKREYDKQGVVRLGGFATGSVHLLSKKPVRDINEFQGLTVRAAGPQATVLKAAGAVPVSLKFGELYEALDRGVVNATVMYELSIMSYRLNEVARHFTYIGAGHAMQAEIINKDYWDALPADIRKIMAETMNEAEIMYAHSFSAKLMESTKRLEAGEGTTQVSFYHLPPAQLKEWQEKSSNLYEEWVKKNSSLGDTAEMRKAFQDLLEKYEAEVKSKGYPKN